MTHILKRSHVCWATNLPWLLASFFSRQCVEGYLVGWYRSGRYAYFMGNTLFMGGRAWARLVPKDKVAYLNHDYIMPGIRYNYWKWNVTHAANSFGWTSYHVPFMEPDGNTDPYEYIRDIPDRSSFTGNGYLLLPEVYRVSIAGLCEQAAHSHKGYRQDMYLNRATERIENANAVAQHIGAPWRFNLTEMMAEANARVRKMRGDLRRRVWDALPEKEKELRRHRLFMAGLIAKCNRAMPPREDKMAYDFDIFET